MARIKGKRGNIYALRGVVSIYVPVSMKPSFKALFDAIVLDWLEYNDLELEEHFEEVKKEEKTKGWRISKRNQIEKIT